MIKHDPRVERPEARGDGDWGVVRDACPTLSGARLPGTRGCSGSMDGRRRAGADVPRPGCGRSFTASWKAQLDLGVPELELECEAALRLLVPTDNNTKNGLGFPMAVAQGLWSALTSATIASRWTASCGSRQSSLESTRVMAPPRRPGCWRGWQRCGRRVRGAADERGRWRGAGSAAGSYGAGGEARALGCGAGPLLSLTPGGSAAAPAGYWGKTGSRPAPRCRAQSPPGRRGSPSSPRE